MFSAYLVTNTMDGMLYVGITTKAVDRRWKSHCAKAMGGSTLDIHKAIRKYGAAAFCIEWVASCTDLESLWATEQTLIAQYDTLAPKGYNRTIGGNGGNGYKFTEQQLKRLSDAHKGLVMSMETRQKMSVASRARRHTEETKKKMSAVQQKRYNKMSLAERKLVARHLIESASSPEGRRKSKDTMMALRNDPQRGEKIRNGHLGFCHSEDTREKMRASRMAFLNQNGPLPVKLDAYKAGEIKWLLSNSVWPQGKIADFYGVGQTHVSMIGTGRVWKNAVPVSPLMG